MEVFFGILFLIIVSYMFGYFVGYNKGFDKLEKIQQKYFGKNYYLVSEDKFDEFLNEKTDKEQIAKITSVANAFEKKARKTEF